MIIPLQRPLPDNTQHSQHTNIQALGGIQTHDRSRRAAVDLLLRPRGHWDRHALQIHPVYVACDGIRMVRQKKGGHFVLQARPINMNIC